MAINLQKDQKVNLQKPGGAALNKCFAGLGWDISDKAGRVDMDVSASCFTAEKKPTESIYFGRLKSANGSIRHGGDNLTGKGEGDDERLEIDLFDVPKDVKYVVITVCVYTGQPFSVISNGFCRIVESKAQGSEICRYNLSTSGESSTGMVLGMFIREDSGWEFKAIGIFKNGKTYQDLLPKMKELL